MDPSRVDRRTRTSWQRDGLRRAQTSAVDQFSRSLQQSGQFAQDVSFSTPQHSSTNFAGLWSSALSEDYPAPTNARHDNQLSTHMSAAPSQTSPSGQNSHNLTQLFQQSDGSHTGFGLAEPFDDPPSLCTQVYPGASGNFDRGYYNQAVGGYSQGPQNTLLHNSLNGNANLSSHLQQDASSSLPTHDSFRNLGHLTTNLASGGSTHYSHHSLLLPDDVYSNSNSVMNNSTVSASTVSSPVPSSVPDKDGPRGPGPTNETMRSMQHEFPANCSSQQYTKRQKPRSEHRQSLTNFGRLNGVCEKHRQQKRRCECGRENRVPTDRRRRKDSDARSRSSAGFVQEQSPQLDQQQLVALGPIALDVDHISCVNRNLLTGLVNYSQCEPLSSPMVGMDQSISPVTSQSAFDNSLFSSTLQYGQPPGRATTGRSVIEFQAEADLTIPIRTNATQVTSEVGMTSDIEKSASNLHVAPGSTYIPFHISPVQLDEGSQEPTYPWEGLETYSQPCVPHHELCLCDDCMARFCRAD